MKPARLAGFTLVELLIALVLTGLIMTLLFAGLRLTSRAWDSADQRQQVVSEQYQLQRLLRRLLGAARSERVRVEARGIRIAFHGEPEQLIFVAPRHAADSGGGLLWYRLRLRADTDSTPAALVLDTLPFDRERTLDWRRLFEPESGVDADGEPWPQPQQHVLTTTGPARLRFAYRVEEDDGSEAIRDEWIDRGTLPRLVELSLQAEAADDLPAADFRLLQPSWSELAIAIREYSHALRSDGF